MVLQATLTFQPLPISSHTDHDKVSSSALTDGPSHGILIHCRPQAAEPVNQLCGLIPGPKINLPYKVYTSTPLSQTWKAGWYRGAFFALFCSFPQKKTGRLTYLSMVGKHSSTELGSSFRLAIWGRRIGVSHHRYFRPPVWSWATIESVRCGFLLYIYNLYVSL